jgi:hypothetical protein
MEPSLKQMHVKGTICGLGEPTCSVVDITSVLQGDDYFPTVRFFVKHLETQAPVAQSSPNASMSSLFS